MGLLTAFALIMVRSLSRTESPGAYRILFRRGIMIGGIATLPFGWAARAYPNCCVSSAPAFSEASHISA